MSPEPFAEQLFAAIAGELQLVPRSAPRTSRVAATVMANNGCLARASEAMLGMEDHPDTFDAWCRAFAQWRGDA